MTHAGIAESVRKIIYVHAHHHERGHKVASMLQHASWGHFCDEAFSTVHSIFWKIFHHRREAS
jgi:hypothetical protein